MQRPATMVSLYAFVLAGCSATARLYPVQGPLSQQNPPPVYVARLTDGLHSGKFKVVLSDGEVGNGQWNAVPRPSKSSDSTASASPSNNMAAEWDLVYGQGFYVAHVLGARLYAKAEIAGDRGTVLHAELYRPDRLVTEREPQSVASIKGVAKDDKGNVYKIAF